MAGLALARIDPSAVGVARQSLETRQRLIDHARWDRPANCRVGVAAALIHGALVSTVTFTWLCSHWLASQSAPNFWA